MDVGTRGVAGRTVAELVAEDYTRAGVLRRLGIDFCCGGKRTVEAACDAAGVSPETLEEELATADRTGRSYPDPRDWDPAFLTDYIVEVHHGYVRKTLPVLRQFSEKVAMRHGEARPELPLVRDLVTELADAMEEHMADEEDDVFPRILTLVAGLGNGSAPTLAEVGLSVAKLEDDHDHAGALMRRIRHITGDFNPPPGACATYRATYAMLEEFEEDLHRHVHLENNVLFPRVAAFDEESGTRA